MSRYAELCTNVFVCVYEVPLPRITRYGSFTTRIVNRGFLGNEIELHSFLFSLGKNQIFHFVHCLLHENINSLTWCLLTGSSQSLQWNLHHFDSLLFSLEWSKLYEWKRPRQFSIDLAANRPFLWACAAIYDWREYLCRFVNSISYTYE